MVACLAGIGASPSAAPASASQRRRAQRPPSTPRAPGRQRGIVSYPTKRIVTIPACNPAAATVTSRRLSPTRAAADDEVSAEDAASPATAEEEPPLKPKKIKDNVPTKSSASLGKGVNLFDPAATASRFITRRFGFTGGLVFVGLLASVEGGEILKALLERDTQGSGETVVLPSGLSYVDERVGGGTSPKKGDFVGVHLKMVVVNSGDMILDTKATGRPIAFIFMKRPLLAPVCAGLEEAVTTMGRGGIRRVMVPANLGFGAVGAILPGGTNIPPNAALDIVVSLEDVSPSYL
uniref:peptidylprolyl isomerase n=1 Tax=Mantoniella antarctica TaxID=81844 RepID=A0A7S0T4T9_9CHLO